MQTNLIDLYKNSAIGNEADAILRSCVHCGFCNATCPTYQLLGDELDGPRGRIYQIKQLLEGQPANTNIQLHLDRCLTCRACETTCPSGVQYNRLLDIGRELVDEQLSRSLLANIQRKLLIHLLSTPARANILFTLGRIAKPFLPSSLAQKIPDRVSFVKTKTIMRTRKMLLLDGCVQPAAAPQINAACVRVFDKIGIQLLTIAESGCCGALPFHLSDTEKAKQYARNNINAWWSAIEQDAEAIVITASGCAPMVKDYAHLLRDDKEYSEKAKRVSALAKDLSEILEKEDLSKLTKTEKKIAFHSPCTLQHGQKINGVIENILSRTGYNLTRVRDSHLCCGSAGTYSILQAEISEQLRDQKLDALQANQPELIATANIGCLLQLQSNSNVPVKHWIELLNTP